MSGLYPIIGMSPGNSYFKDDEVRYLLKTVVERYGRVGIFVADVPAIATYMALGYSENRARRDKAIPKGNALKNRVRKIMGELGYSAEVVRIFEWEEEIENNEVYKQKYQQVLDLYHNNQAFQYAANSTTRAVLEGSEKSIADLDKATQTAVHYLLSELAFLEFAPDYLGVEKVAYVYHKNWLVYEDYIAGRFDGVVRPQLDFILLENPYETYNPMWGLENEDEPDFIDVLDRIQKTKVLRVGFADYAPAFVSDSAHQNFSGVFYDIIMAIAKKYDWHVRWTEEVGYGVIIDGLEHNRFDIFGSTVWPTPERLQKAEFSVPLYQSPVFVWTRPDFGKTNDEIQQSEMYRVAVKENDITDSIAKADFPTNRQVRVPQLADPAEVLKLVAENRADFTFVETSLAEIFNKTSPIKLVPTSTKPIRVYDNAFMMKQGETRLKEFWDAELTVLKKTGKISL